MSDFSRIEYLDLKWEAVHKRLPEVFGRATEYGRLSRILGRTLQHHAVIMGPSGIGKSSFLLGWAKTAAEDILFSSFTIVKLNTQSLQGAPGKTPAAIQFYSEAFKHLTNGIVIIDDFGSLLYNQAAMLQAFTLMVKPVLENSGNRLILSLTPEEVEWIKQTQPGFLNPFETLELKPQPTTEQLLILKHQLNTYSETLEASDETLTAVINFVQRFPILGTLPSGSIKLLDECVAEAKLHRPPQTYAHPLLKYLAKKPPAPISISAEIAARIVAEKTGIPLTKLNGDERQELKTLPERVTKKVVGQDRGVGTIVSIIQRGRLGLRATNRPLGSFLVLGPSGVGKTETAKILAEELYGKPESFLRIDMSEFGEPHTVHRLVGSPPGYLGFESGGQMTNHFKKEPYSLLLLDEIEKSHPKIFDIFLQILDDGRITSGQGETVDMTQAVVMATSNLGVQEIIAGYQRGENIHDPEFIERNITPILLKSFRMEFLNRFDAVVVFNPLSVEDLVRIAMLEIKKIEQRVAEHNIRFNITPEILKSKITQLADPRFGARPVKRYIEEVCETLVTRSLLQ